MDNRSPAKAEPTNTLALPLLDRMDDAVGEASSVMGAVMTELLRRTLRGGVSQIGEGLTAYVGEQVDATIADRTPAIEQAAADVADRTARTAATEVVVEEVRALESRARQSDEQLACRIDETAQRLTGRIEETHQHVEQATTATAERLTSRVHEVERSAEERARDLAAQIAEAERRAAEAANAETARQVQVLMDRSKETVKALKGRLDSVEASSETLTKRFEEEQNDRRSELAALKADAQERVLKVAQHFKQQEAAQRTVLDQLRAELEGLAQANQLLSARVAELEKPRGLRRLWLWLKSGWNRLFGRSS